LKLRTTIKHDPPLSQKKWLTALRQRRERRDRRQIKFVIIVARALLLERALLVDNPMRPFLDVRGKNGAPEGI
jgi:hypothetical protein